MQLLEQNYIFTSSIIKILAGTDDQSKTLEKVADEAGVLVKYQKTADHPTGKCAVLITGQDRSLVTKLDAANHFTTAHLDVAENWNIVESARIFYSAGFFLTVSPDSMLKVAEHAQKTGKNFCMNLSAPFLCEFFKDPMLKVCCYTKVVCWLLFLSKLESEFAFLN